MLLSRLRFQKHVFSGVNIRDMNTKSTIIKTKCKLAISTTIGIELRQIASNHLTIVLVNSSH